MDDFGDFYNPLPASQPGRSAMNKFPPVENAGLRRGQESDRKALIGTVSDAGVNDAVTSAYGSINQEENPMEGISDSKCRNTRPASQPGRTATTTFPTVEKAGFRRSSKVDRNASSRTVLDAGGDDPVTSAYGSINQEGIQMATGELETTMTISETDLLEETTESGFGFQDDADGDCTGLMVRVDPPKPGDDSAAALHEGADDDDESGLPQIVRDVDLPEDFDYHDLKPRRYGKILPPLTDLERQNLEKSIVDHGFFGRILIDEWLNIIEGNVRWELCLEHGITPVVEMISGLSEAEKEGLALASNLDRRQLKDPDEERRVLEARFDNALDRRKEDPKKYPLKRIAAELGVSVATVSSREQLRHKSDDDNMSKPDARRVYDQDVELEAVRLVKEGMSQAEVARKVLMHPKAVQRAVNKAKRRESGGGAAKDGEGTKAARDVATGSMVPNDGIPRLHLLALERLGREAEAYAAWLHTASAKARDVVGAVSPDVSELLDLALYASQLAAAADLRLRQILDCGEDGDGAGTPPPEGPRPDTDTYRVGTAHLGSVLCVVEDGVYVSLPGGGSGVIDVDDMCLQLNAPSDEGETVRVRVTGFDPVRGLAKLRLLGRQAFTQDDRADTDGPSTADVEFSDRNAVPEEKEVI